MAFRNIPPNGFPAIPDIEDLEAVVKDVGTLKTTTAALAEDVGDLEDQKANQITIALTFNPETEYEVGDLVYYNGLTYRCTNAHAGEWDADDFAGTTIANELATLKSGLTDITDVTATVNSELIDNPSLANIYAKKQGKLLFVSAYINPRTSGGVDVASNTTIFTLSGVTLLIEVFCSSNSSDGNPTRLKLGTNGVIKNESPMKNAEWYSMSFVGLIN